MFDLHFIRKALLIATITIALAFIGGLYLQSSLEQTATERAQELDCYDVNTWNKYNIDDTINCDFSR